MLLRLLTENRFPAIWIPFELRDLRALLRHRDQRVRMRARVKNALQGLALAHGVRRGAGLWSRDGRATLASLSRGEVECFASEIVVVIRSSGARGPWDSRMLRDEERQDWYQLCEVSGNRPTAGDL